MHRTLSNALTLTAFAVLALTVLAGCGGEPADESTGGDAEGEVPTLRLGHVGHDHHLALYVAALEGERFKADYGTYLEEVKPREVYDLADGGRRLARLQFLKVGGGSRMPAAMSRNEIAIGLGGTVPVAKFADQGQPFKILAPLNTDGDMLVMQTDSPISDWAAFVKAAKEGEKPLRIGYKAPVAVAKLVFERALVAEGIPYGYDRGETDTGVILVNFGSEKSPIPLMESGAIDGFVMNQPAVAVAANKGLGKTIAHLRDLPPEGKWVNHPCCCVSATAETMAAHPDVLKGLLKVLLLSTHLIHEDQALAVDCAHRWTKYPLEVERASVPTITYIAEPTESWVTGMKTWAEMVKEVNLFEGKYAGATPQAFVDDVLSLGLVREAARELREKDLLPAP
jgi:NitT/TauT family transport system substrate-binding protein